MSIFKPITDLRETLIDGSFLEQNGFIFDVYGSDPDYQRYYDRIPINDYCHILLIFKSPYRTYELTDYEFRHEGYRVPSFFDDINTNVKTIAEYYEFLETVRIKAERYNGTI